MRRDMGDRSGAARSCSPRGWAREYFASARQALWTQPTVTVTLGRGTMERDEDQAHGQLPDLRPPLRRLADR